jgi:hypothetical protein
MDVSRRSFLRGVLSVAVVATANPSIVLASAPTIYADGIHDDAPGLQAMFDGKPFNVEGNVIAASNGILAGGCFMIGKTLVLSHARRFSITDCHFRAMKGFDQNAPLLSIERQASLQGTGYLGFQRAGFDLTPNTKPLQ